MTDKERNFYVRLNRRLRRLGARAEALACGYVTADMQRLGSESESRLQLLREIRELAEEVGIIHPQKPNNS